MRDLSGSSSSTLLFCISCAVCFYTGVAQDWSAGNPECPCIDPWSRGLQLTPETSPPTGCNLSRSPEAEVLCYNQSYGSQGCRHYDWDSTPDCTSAQKMEWCEAQWCYVDGTNCSRDFAESDYFPEAVISSESGTQPLVFSYATCGWVDMFSDTEVVQPLLKAAASRPNGSLRVAFPDGSVSGYTVVGPPKVQPGQGVKGTDYSGSFLSFMGEAFKRRNIPYEVVPISLRSRQYSPNSSFTACVHEVAIGNADMCWGNFWPTAKRSRIASFAQPVYDDRFRVLVWAHHDGVNLWDSKYMWEAICGPFEALAPSLWCTLLFVFGYTGVVLNFHQIKEHRCSAKSFLFQLPRSILQGWQAMFSGEFLGAEIRSIGGWLVSISAGFSVLVMFTTYTAVVTTDLLATRQQGAVSSLEEGIRRGYRFCWNADLEEVIVSRYPELQSHFVESFLGDAVDSMDAGDCEAAVIHEDFWYHVRAKSDKHCIGKTAKVMLPNVVTTLGNSVPVRPDLVSAVSWMIRKEIERGEYDRHQKVAKSKFLDPACTELDAATQKTKLHVSDMLGPLSFLLIMATASMIFTLLSMRVKRGAKEIAEALDDDGDGSVTYEDVVSSVRRRFSSEANSPTSTSSRSPTRAPSSTQRDLPASIGRPSAAEDTISI